MLAIARRARYAGAAHEGASPLNLGDEGHGEGEIRAYEAAR
jgi:hypothetical protein